MLDRTPFTSYSHSFHEFLDPRQLRAISRLDHFWMFCHLLLEETQEFKKKLSRGDVPSSIEDLLADSTA
jgi:hypothetical protein